jgi:hypothetical protein
MQLVAARSGLSGEGRLAELQVRGKEGKRAVLESLLNMIEVIALVDLRDVGNAEGGEYSIEGLHGVRDADVRIISRTRQGCQTSR